MGFFEQLLSAAVYVGAYVGAAFLTQGMSIGYQMAATFAASMIVSRIFAPNAQAPATQQNNIRQQVPPDPTAGIPLVYGDAYTGGRFVDAVLTTDQQTMFYVQVISCISPNGQFSFDTTKFYYQDQLITFDTSDLTKVVSLTDGAGNVDTSISGHLFISLYTSTPAGVVTRINTPNYPWQTMSTAVGIASGQEWASTGRYMNGTAFAIVRLVYNTGSAGTTSLQAITYHVSHYLNSTGAAKPGDVWYDYITNTTYGGAVDSTLVDSASATALNSYSDALISYTPYSGGTATIPRYRFNGVLDTGQTVLSNIDLMMNSCDCWQAYDASTGKWKVVINRDITPTFSFDDNNILGAITVGATDITQQVNQVEAKFNDSTNRDQPGYVNMALQVLNPSILYPNEPINKYTVSFDLVNSSVTAQYLATRILEQNRLDLIVGITTNYTGIQVNAGDVVTVTNAAYGWSAKQFRVMQVKESSLPDGSLGASLQLTAYDSAVYTTPNITQYTPTPNSGLASINYFSPLSAPYVSASRPADSIPSFDIAVTTPTVGRTTTLKLFYSTYATPTTSQWTLLDSYTSSASAPLAQGSTFTFLNEILPAGTYYFGVIASNDISQSLISAVSSAFVWNPTGTTGTQTATVYLYQWLATTPSNPSGTSTWTWATATNSSYTGGGGWSVTIPTNPGTSGLALWQASISISAPATSTTTTVSWASGYAITAISVNGTAGTAGNSFRIAYLTQSQTLAAPSVSPNPTTGSTSFPTSWSGTITSPGAGQSLWAIDGTYVPGTNQTTWGAPYLTQGFPTTIQSDNYVPNTSGWQIQRDTGNAYFNAITARGDITGGTNITVSGQAKFNGSFSSGPGSTAVEANQSYSASYGVISYTNTAGAGAVYGLASGGSGASGLIGLAGTSGQYGARIGNNYGGVGLSLVGITTTTDQIQSTVATGTAPLTVTSTTLVSNLNSEIWGGAKAQGTVNNGSSGSLPTAYPPVTLTYNLVKYIQINVGGVTGYIPVYI